MEKINKSLIKYPVYVSVFHNYLPDGVKAVRFLVESGEELQQMYEELCALGKENINLGAGFQFEGYPSVVGDLPLGPITK